jgi:uncharacterized protein RhaS with RHS repeats
MTPRTTRRLPTTAARGRERTVGLRQQFFLYHGNRTKYAYDAANQLRYGLDFNGRTTYAFDPNGNQHVEREPSGSRTTTIWDFENQPRGMLLPSGSRITYAYNADFRRVEQEE